MEKKLTGVFHGKKERKILHSHLVFAVTNAILFFLRVEETFECGTNWYVRSPFPLPEVLGDDWKIVALEIFEEVTALCLLVPCQDAPLTLAP